MGSSRRTQKEQAMQPYAIGNGEEIYVGVNQEGRRSPWFVRDTTALNMAGTRLFVRSDSVRPVEGMLFLPRSDWSGMEAYRFRLPPSSGNRQEAKAAFYQAKEAHYEGLLARNIPGAAWFRHQRDQLALPVETDTSGRRR